MHATNFIINRISTRFKTSFPESHIVKFHKSRIPLMIIYLDLARPSSSKIPDRKANSWISHKFVIFISLDLNFFKNHQ